MKSSGGLEPSPNVCKYLEIGFVQSFCRFLIYKGQFLTYEFIQPFCLAQSHICACRCLCMYTHLLKPKRFVVSFAVGKLALKLFSSFFFRWFAKLVAISCWPLKNRNNFWIIWRDPVWPISRKGAWRKRSPKNAGRRTLAHTVVLSTVGLILNPFCWLEFTHLSSADGSST